MLKLSLCQMKVIDSKIKNIEKAVEQIKYAKKNGADIVVLPEMFCCPYDNTKFKEYAEEISDSSVVKKMSEISRTNNIYLIAGSMPEYFSGKLYNTSIVFDKKGNLIAKHRKIHLFDIDVKGKITFKESDVLTSGNEVTIFDTEFCRVGLIICYDIRFPELSRIMALKGVKLIIVPAAFNMTTGPAHWELLIRTRALDNQVYMGVCSPARDLSSNYVAYGHSMIVDPWGNIIIDAGNEENIISSKLEMKYLDKIREELPVLKHRRKDVYKKYNE